MPCYVVSYDLHGADDNVHDKVSMDLEEMGGVCKPLDTQWKIVRQDMSLDEIYAEARSILDDYKERGELRRYALTVFKTRSENIRYHLSRPRDR